MTAREYGADCWMTVSEAKAVLAAVKLVHGPGLCDDHTCPLCWRPAPRDMALETNGRSAC